MEKRKRLRRRRPGVSLLLLCRRLRQDGAVTHGRAHHRQGRAGDQDQDQGQGRGRGRSEEDIIHSRPRG